MKQLTPDEAIAFHDEGKWKAMSLRERAIFQIEQDCLAMPFSVFHEAVEKTLGRPVFTHEFGLNRDGLLAELNGAPAATMEEVFGLLPADRTLIVST